MGKLNSVRKRSLLIFLLFCAACVLKDLHGSFLSVQAGETDKPKPTWNSDSFDVIQHL